MSRASIESSTPSSRDSTWNGKPAPSRYLHKQLDVTSQTLALTDGRAGCQTVGGKRERFVISQGRFLTPACVTFILNDLGSPDFMIILVTIVHVIVCLFLIIVVLLQSGKAGDISAAFGGQGSQAAFGPRGAATALSKATTLSAVLFMLTSVTLSIYAIKHGGPSSVLQDVKSAPAKTQPAAPAAPANPPAKK